MPVTEYTWDPVTDSIMEETDGVGSVLASYTNEPSPYGPLISQRSGGATRYFHFDALGSTRELTDDAENVTDAFTYDAWGVEVHQNGTSETAFRWVGQWGYHLSVGPMSIRHRVFSHDIAVWLSIDPTDGEYSLQQYHYSANSPISLVDPEGLAPITVQFAAFIGGWRGTWLREPFSNRWFFKTDERTFGQPGTSRLKSVSRIDSCQIGSQPPVGVNIVGASHRRKLAFRYVRRYPIGWQRQYYWHNETATAPLINDLSDGFYVHPCQSHIHFVATASYPFAPLYIAPAIDYTVTVNFFAGRDSVVVAVSGAHDGFPDYELIINGQVLYSYMSPYAGPSFVSLGGGPEVPFRAVVSLPLPTSCDCLGTC